MKFSAAIKNKRKELGLTQAQMIDGVGITRFQFSKIENGSRKMYVDDLLKMFRLRGIDGQRFWDDYFANDENSLNKLKVLTSELTKAFYDSDLEQAKRIRKQLLKMKDVSEEQQYHALLICRAIEGKINKINVDDKQALSGLLFKNENWTRSIDSLRVFGNTMPLFDQGTLNTLMKSVLKEYRNLSKEDESTQLRIAEICVNYLYNSRIGVRNLEAKKAISILGRLSNKPVFTLYKLLGVYFKGELSEDAKSMNLIKNTLRLLGYEAILNKLVDRGQQASQR